MSRLRHLIRVPSGRLLGEVFRALSRLQEPPVTNQDTPDWPRNNSWSSWNCRTKWLGLVEKKTDFLAKAAAPRPDLGSEQENPLQDVSRYCIFAGGPPCGRALCTANTKTTDSSTKEAPRANGGRFPCANSQREIDTRLSHRGLVCLFVGRGPQL